MISSTPSTVREAGGVVGSVGMAAGAVGGGWGGGRGHSPDERDGAGVTGLVRHHARAPPPAGEREVANTVHGLVANELVGPAELVLDDAALVEHDGVLGRGALDQALGAQRLHLAHEAERARTG